jgi:glycosyltransferase involved in cell wall biosynthesis
MDDAAEKTIVSVIMPVYNRANTIAFAINSVLFQIYQNFELIIIDDFSTDETCDKISQFKDHRIKLIKLTENAGPANARNFGIKASKGKFISFLDSDDEYDPDFLIESVRKLDLSPSSTGFIWTGTRFIVRKTGLILSTGVWKPQLKESPYLTLLHSLHIGTNSGITVRREVFGKVGLFDDRLSAAEDTDFFLRASQQYAFDYIQEPLISVYRDDRDRLSKDFNKIIQAYRIILPKHSLEIQKSKHLRIKFNYKMMWLSYHTNCVKEARSHFSAIRKDKIISVRPWFLFFLFEFLGQKRGSRLHLNLSARK